MDDVGDDPRLSQLTAEMAWVRRLARALLRDHDADDLAQEAWIVAAEHPPADDRPLRPWLTRVIVNLARMRTRSHKRRGIRETRSTELVEPPATPDDLVERVELQQLVAGEVLALAEPYRSTVLLHYFEGLTSAEIARRLQLPEGTVRRRLKVALDELRARIEAKHRGSLAALAPLAGLHKPALGVIAMKKIIAAIVILILLVVGGVLWTKRDKHESAANGMTADTSSRRRGNGRRCLRVGCRRRGAELARAAGCEAAADCRTRDVRRKGARRREGGAREPRIGERTRQCAAGDDERRRRVRLWRPARDGVERACIRAGQGGRTAGRGSEEPDRSSATRSPRAPAGRVHRRAGGDGP